jgi:hypothetical protein
VGLQETDWDDFIGQMPLDANSLILRAFAEAVRFIGILYVVKGGLPTVVFPYQRHWYHGTPGDANECLGPQAAVANGKGKSKKESVDHLAFAPFVAIPSTCDLTDMSRNLQMVNRDDERKDRPIAVWISDKPPKRTTRIWGWNVSTARPVHDIVGLPVLTQDPRKFELIVGFTETAPYWTSRENFVFALDDKNVTPITIPGRLIEPTDPW